mgnify:CR=1 FL=1
MFDSVDMFTSRRTMFDLSYYWHRREEDLDDNAVVYVDTDLNEMIYERSPDGCFYAKETDGIDSSNQKIGSGFMFDEHYTTIMTRDNLELNQNDIIVFREKVWRVTSIRKRVIGRQNQYSRKPGYETIISLKG